jgi:Zn-dependent peptidase ImmA (M78 family)
MKQSNNINTSQRSQRIVGAKYAASTLQALRALHPKRVLTWTEAKAIAARQANRLRARHEGNHDFAFDAEIISGQPRLLIDVDDQIDVAGSSHWTGSHWKILLNADDHPSRRRFTLAHEYKHIIDHGTPIAPDLEEKICDHFAACLLMPKQKVIAAWTDPDIPQRVNAMAAAFVVSPQAMRYRLLELGLLERTYQRCGGVRVLGRDQSRKKPPGSIYYRQTPTQLARVT